MNNYLFLSAESSPPAGYILSKTIFPAEAIFNQKHHAKEYGDALNSVGIIFICTSEDLIAAGFYHDRKYISHKKKYADYRLRLPFLPFIQASEEQRMHMCLEIICAAAIDIKRKIPSFLADKFCTDIKSAAAESLKLLPKEWDGNWRHRFDPHK